MSARLSVTVITRVDTRLNAATATMSVEDDEHHAFFQLHGGKPVRFCASSRAHTGRHRGCQSVAGPLCGPVQVFELRRMPVGLPGRKMRGRVIPVQQRQPRVGLAVAGAEGADHRHLRFRRGTTPAGGSGPLGVIRERLSPSPHAQAAGQISPSTMPNCSWHQPRQHGLSGKQVGHFCLPGPDRHRAPVPHLHVPFVPAAPGCDERSRAHHLRVGLAFRVSATSGRPHHLGQTPMCDSTPSMRSRTSFWKAVHHAGAR